MLTEIYLVIFLKKFCGGVLIQVTQCVVDPCVLPVLKVHYSVRYCVLETRPTGLEPLRARASVPESSSLASGGTSEQASHPPPHCMYRLSIFIASVFNTTTSQSEGDERWVSGQMDREVHYRVTSLAAEQKAMKMPSFCYIEVKRRPHSLKSCIVLQGIVSQIFFFKKRHHISRLPFKKGYERNFFMKLCEITIKKINFNEIF